MKSASPYSLALLLLSAIGCLTMIGCSSGTNSTTTPTQVAMPVFTPAAGTYATAQSVTITDATAGATIYYTTNGTTPNSVSTPYTGAIAVSSNTTLEAIAISNATSSSVVTAAYTIPPPTPAPTFSLAGNTYTSAQSVTLADTDSAATIYYATDGTNPTTSSPVYSSAIAVAATKTVKAFATESGHAPSAIVSATYVINIPPASLAIVSGSGQSSQTGNGFTTPLEAQVFDAGKNPIAGVSVTFSAPAAGASASLSSTICTTDGNGLCSVTARANTSLGTYTVAASIGALNASFTLTNTGAHSYVVTAATDTTTGVAANCIDQSSSSGPANDNCSLRDALSAAAANATNTLNASITFAQTQPTTITLANGTLNIPSYTTIQGATSGSGLTLTNLITIDGNNATTVFTEPGGVTQAAINNLTISHGYSSTYGGGILMSGTLAVNNTTFSANHAAVSGGAMSNVGGNLTVFGSTFVDNHASLTSGNGGAIVTFSNTSASISNSTFTANQAYRGGAIYTAGSAVISDSTISGNTASLGGGYYNFGLSNNIAPLGVYRSIINGNTNEDCGGIFCSTSWAYALFSQNSSPASSVPITINFSDSLGNIFSQTFSTGPFSTPQSLASGFGSYFSQNTSGLDTTPIGAQADDSLLIISPANGATLGTLNITNSGSSFTVVQTNPSILVGSNNVYGLTATQANLAPLANNGGPTQTMLPLTGSPALCAISPSTETGTDQRGQPRTLVLGSTTCQDAGAVQTSN